MAFRVQYYTLTEPEMQSLICRAQDGDGAAQEELLKVFRNFLHKYTVVLTGGKINFADYDLRRFVALYVKDTKLRYMLKGNKLNPGGEGLVNEAMQVITFMVNRYGDFEDVQQTVDLAFLQCVQIYRPRGEIPFSAYLYSYFFYVLKKQVDMLLVYQLGRKSYPLFDQEEWEDDMSPPGFAMPAAPPVPSADELVGAVTIDELWVAGDTAYGVFATLSVHERQLIKWHYVDGEKTSVIATRITEQPVSLRATLAGIRRKLRADDFEELDLTEVPVAV
jgi:hypothetical protein